MILICRLLSCIRYREVLVLQGAPVMGSILAMGTLTIHRAVIEGCFVIASCSLVAHTWSLNDWADYHADSANVHRSPSVFTRQGVSPATMIGFSLFLLCVSLAIFAVLSTATFWIAIGLLVLSCLYSFPSLHAKRIAFLSSFVHLSGGFLHFLLGYSLFATVDANAIWIAIGFALIFTAGHGVQEVQDHDADRFMGIRTNAVVFGKNAVFRLTLMIFVSAYGYLAYLASTGFLPSRLRIPSLVFAALQIHFARQALVYGLTFESVNKYRTRYRILFGLLGLMIISTLFL